MHQRPTYQIFIALFGVVIGLVVVSFTAGYYCARHFLAEELMQLCQQEELSDIVAAACYALGGERMSGQEREQEHLQSDSGEERKSEQRGEVGHHQEACLPDQEQLQAVDLQENNGVQDGVQGGEALPRWYQAVLIGFGESRSAEKYVSKLSSIGIEARVIKRTGKNRKGREVTWYQVVTKSMPYDDLSALVARLQKTDRLEGVMIIEVEMAMAEEDKK